MVSGIFIRIFRKNTIFYDLYKNEIAMPALNMSACTMRISKHDIYMTMIKNDNLWYLHKSRYMNMCRVNKSEKMSKT